MTALVGYTGFVGSNIYAGSDGAIGAVYNSKNISDAFGTKPDLLIFAGLRAEKFLANTEPEKDLALVRQAQENIAKIDPANLVLISTIDVFADPAGADENTKIDTDGLQAYGYNRYQLELWVRDRYPDALIIRLPGLFGKNIKKNFIYDFINVIPSMLKADKFSELASRDEDLRKYYRLQENGFYKVEAGDPEKALLRKKFAKLGFSALNFTDSRSVYQFYNLARLWGDIRTALGNGIRVLHPATEPVSAAEVYEYLTGEPFENILAGTPARYDYRTVHDALFGGAGGYICSKQTVLKEIWEFVEASRHSQGDRL